MPWCPKCKNEYVEGTKECADCGCALVETLTERKAVIFGEKEQMEKLKEFLEYSKISDVAVKQNEEDDTYELFVREEDETQARKLVNVFLKEEAKQKAEMEAQEGADKAEADETQEDLNRNVLKYTGVYQDSAAKAEDNKSSAYTLLFVGGVGLVVIALCMFGVIDLNLNETSKYMVYGVMGALFILFIVMGVVSMRSYKIFAQKAQKEDNLTGEIRKWCLADLTAEKVDEQLSEEDKALADEMKYFKRTEILKKLISEKFLNLDEAYLEHFVDDIYPEIFEAEE